MGADAYHRVSLTRWCSISSSFWLHKLCVCFRFSLGLGLKRRCCFYRETTGSTIRYEILLALCGLVFSSHLQVFLVYFGGLGLVLLMDWPGPKAYIRRMLHCCLWSSWIVAPRHGWLPGGEAWAETVSKRYETDWRLPQSGWDDAKFSERLLSVY